MSIELILGPMTGGKTTEMLRRINRHKYTIQNKIIVIKYFKDNRFKKEENNNNKSIVDDSKSLRTHDSIDYPAFECGDKLQDIFTHLLEYDVIGIDEGQFFSDIVSICEQLASKGKKVVVSALDGNYQRKGFGDILNLIPLAEKVDKYNAICLECKINEAPFTIIHGQTFEEDLKGADFIARIGGTDKYTPICRKCRYQILESNSLLLKN